MSFRFDRFAFQRIGATAFLLLLGACAASPDTGNDNHSDAANDNVDTSPAITLLEPTQDFTVTQGDTFEIQWEDSDIDSNADISLLLLPSNGLPAPLGTFSEDEDGEADSLTVDTAELDPGMYMILVTIADGMNPEVSTLQLNLDGVPLLITVEES